MSIIFKLFSCFFDILCNESFVCPKSIRNYEKKIMLGTSDAWLLVHPIDPVILRYIKTYFVDCPYAPFLDHQQDLGIFVIGDASST